MPNVALHTIVPGSSEKIGAFDVDFIKMSHSIAGAVAMAAMVSGIMLPP